MSSLKDQRCYKDPNKLVSLYRRHGNFDETRKQLFEEFKQSDQYIKLKQDLVKFVSNAVGKDPYILNKNRGQTAALLHSQFMSKNSSSSIEEFLEAKFKNRGADNQFLRKLTQDLNHEFTKGYIEPRQDVPKN